MGSLPRDVWILGVAMFVNRMGTMVLPFLVLYLTSQLGFSAGRAGFVLSVYGAASLIASPLAGRLCDRWGAIRVLKLNLLLAGLLFGLFPLVRGFGPAVVATAILSLASEGFRPASFALFAERAGPGQRKAAYAMARLAVNLGMSIGPAVGGFLATVSFPAIFWVDAGTSLLALLVLVVRPLDPAPRTVAGTPGGTTEAARRSPPAIRDRRMWPFLLGSVLVAAVFFQLQGAVPLFLVGHLGLSESTYGLMFTLNTIMIVLFEVRLNLETAHWPHRRSMALGALLMGAGLAGIGLCRTAGAVMATTLVWTFGEMILLPSMSSWVADVAPDERRGEYMGWYTMSFGLAFAFAPWAGNVVLDRLGPGMLFAGVLGVGIVAAALTGRLDEGRPAVASLEDA